MSTYRAVAAATAAFAQRIKQSIAPLEGAIVTTERPSAPQVGGPPRVNLFLYHIDANPFLTTDDLPTRRADGSLIEKPKIALDLYYLLSFYGDDKLPALENHVLIGLTMSGIHAKPVLTPEELSAVDGEIIASDFIALTPLPLSIHELSRLWSMFFQVPYTVSVSLKASAAILIADLPAGEALPVARRGLEVVTFSEPKVTSAGAPGFGPGALVFGGELLITGSGFGGDGAAVVIGQTVLRPASGAVVDGRIVLRLDVPTLRAGAQALSVVTAAGFTSPEVGLLLRPAVGAPQLTGETLTLPVRPDVAPGQTTELVLDLLDGAEGAQTTFTLEAAADTPDRLTAAVGELPPGVYAVRARIDRAESLLVFDPMTGRPSPTILLGTPA